MPGSQQTESVTINYSLALSASHLVTYADGGGVPKSYPANLNIAIYTEHTYFNAATCTCNAECRMTVVEARR